MRNYIMRLLPLILISGCVSWTPVEYYDIPPEMEEDNGRRHVIEQEDDLCYGEPIGTFSCADIVETPDSTQCIANINPDCITDQVMVLPW